MYELKFTPTSLKELKKLDPSLHKRITDKLKFFAKQADPISLAKPLVNLPPATHRFRIGNYRATFFIHSKAILIVEIRHRKDIYQS